MVGRPVSLGAGSVCPVVQCFVSPTWRVTMIDPFRFDPGSNCFKLGSASVRAGVYQAVGKKLYVGNLSYRVTDESLAEIFAQYGSVVKAQVVMDRDTGRSRGFGFVEMGDDESAQAAIDGMHDREFEGRRLTVNEARERESRGGGGGGGYGGGGGGGGYGGGGGGRSGGYGGGGGRREGGYGGGGGRREGGYGGGRREGGYGGGGRREGGYGGYEG